MWEISLAFFEKICNFVVIQYRAIATKMAMTYLGNYHYAKSGMMHGLQHIVQTNDWHSNRKLLSIVRSNPTPAPSPLGKGRGSFEVAIVVPIAPPENGSSSTCRSPSGIIHKAHTIHGQRVPLCQLIQWQIRPTRRFLTSTRRFLTKCMVLRALVKNVKHFGQKCQLSID